RGSLLKVLLGYHIKSVLTETKSTSSHPTMPATHYKIADWGDPVGEGVSGSRYINVTGVAKTNVRGEPHIVANEYICARLAAAVGLPVPPGFLVKKDGEY